MLHQAAAETSDPCLLRGITIDRPDQVWANDLTFIPIARGFIYLIAIMDWATRKVLLAIIKYTGHQILR